MTATERSALRSQLAYACQEKTGFSAGDVGDMVGDVGSWYGDQVSDAGGWVADGVKNVADRAGVAKRYIGQAPGAVRDAKNLVDAALDIQDRRDWIKSGVLKNWGDIPDSTAKWLKDTAVGGGVGGAVGLATSRIRGAVTDDQSARRDVLLGLLGAGVGAAGVGAWKSPTGRAGRSVLSLWLRRYYANTGRSVPFGPGSGWGKKIKGLVDGWRD